MKLSLRTDGKAGPGEVTSMRRLRKLNLWRATPAIALSAAVAVLIGGLAIAYFGARSTNEQEIDRATVQGQIIASTVTAALGFNDRMAAQEYVSALHADP